MTQIPTQPEKSKIELRRSPVRRLVLTFFVLFWSLLLCVGLLGAVMQDRTLPLPDSLQVKLHAAINSKPNIPNITFDRVEVGLTGWFHPKLILSSAQFSNVETGTGVRFGTLDVVFDGPALFLGNIAPKSVRLSDANFDITRKKNGSFDFGFDILYGADAIFSIDDALAQTEAFFGQTEFSSLESGQLDQLTVNYVDRINNRAWTFDGGSVSALRAGGVLNLRGDLALLTGGGDVATLGLFYDGKALGEGNLGAEFSNLPAQDLALQSPALTWLSLINGNLSGSFRSTRTLGRLGVLNAILDFGQGTLIAGPSRIPIAYSEAKTYFSYLPSPGRLDIARVSVQSDWGALSADGYALLESDLANDMSSSGMVLHLNVEDSVLMDTPWWQDPVTVSKASSQLKINYDPLQIDVGQFQAEVNGAQFSMSGKAKLEPLGWSFNLLGRAPALGANNVISLWPANLKPKSRRWFEGNVKSGMVKNLTVDARQVAGAVPTLASSFQFDNTDVRFMRSMPRILNGAGYGTFAKSVFTLVLQNGHVKAAEGGKITIDGSVLTVPDTREPDPPASFTINGRGPIHAAMSLLNNEPFKIVAKANRDVADVSGQITFKAQLETWLKKGVKPKNVAYDIVGTLQNVRSEVLVPGQVLTAKSMTFSADPGELQISGDGRLSGIPFSGSWVQPVGAPDVAGRVNVSLELSAETLKTLNVVVPSGVIAGKTTAKLTLKVVKNKPTFFDISSNLQGIILNIPTLKWQKPKSVLGAINFKGTFSKPLKIDGFVFTAPGLSTRGRINFDVNGLESIFLSDLIVADWLTAEVTLTNRGTNVPMQVLVTDGSLDLRKFPQGETKSQTSSATAAPLMANLTRLQISDSVALTDVSAEFPNGIGSGGLFSGQINGGTLISGSAMGSGKKLQLDINSQDGGGALRDAGLLRKATGGVMDLQLTPAEGGWNGDLKISSVRIKDAPQIAQLLSAVSIIGLPDQLDGRGIFFDTLDSKFNLKNELFTIYESSAVGPSLGMSLDGYINTKSKQLDLQGVLSPFYMLNGIGAILTRRGEGLIGFNFNLSGGTAQPDVAVNPLSLFTPGMFREIFRRKPPEQE